MKTIEIDIEDYIDILNEKRNSYSIWAIPNCLWDFFMEDIRKNGLKSEITSPKLVVQNVINKGKYGSFNRYKKDDETDEEFVKRVKNETYFIDEKERIVCFHL